MAVLLWAGRLFSLFLICVVSYDLSMINLNAIHMTNQNSYVTKDQYLASTLFALGLKIIKSEWRGKECFFIFGKAAECAEIVRQYYAGDLKIDPRILFDGFKAIKSMIFNTK